MFVTYRSEIIKDSIKICACSKCNKQVIIAKFSDEGIDKVKISDPDPTRKREFTHGKFEIPQESFEEFYNTVRSDYASPFKNHWHYCFPNGFRFKYEDEIIYNSFKNGDLHYKIVGLDKQGNLYALKLISNNPATHEAKPCWYPISLIDKNAIPLNDAGKLLFT